MIADTVKEVLDYASEEALSSGHTIILPEHLLLALMRDDDVAQFLRDCHIDLTKLANSIDTYLSSDKTEHPETPPDKLLPLTRAIVDKAQAARTQTPQIIPFHLLKAIMTVGSDTYATKLLEEQAVKKQDIKPKTAPAKPARKGGTNLKKYCRNLSVLATDGNTQPAIGREKDMDAILQILSRKTKSSVLVVAEPGVGRTALVEGLPHHLMQSLTSGKVKNTTVFSLDTSNATQAVKHIGSILNDIGKDPDAILVIDDLHTLDDESIKTLQTALSGTQVRCIATTHQKGLKHIQDSSPSFMSTFRKHEMKEPGIEETRQILKRAIQQYEEHHNIRYHPDSLATAIQLADRYITDRKMPEKVLDLVDQVGAEKNIHAPAAEGGIVQIVTSQDIAQAVSAMTGKSVASLSLDERKKLENLEADLRTTVMGQDEAIEIVSDTVRRARAGLNNPDKPLGSFLLQGPTGVGKTELVYGLGAVLNLPVLRFDMSEYSESHSVSRLKGAEPGYIGYDEQPGLLTDPVAKNKHAIVLLDEIEKAHADIYNLLLQVLDYGTLTDNKGQSVSFRDTYVIMTTNAGAAESEQRPMGMNIGNVDGQGKINEALKKIFTPEFRNRLDAIVPFRTLDRSTVLKVTEKFLKRIEDRMMRKNITVSWSEATTTWLADKGYDPKQNARPIERLIQTSIANPISRKIISGELKEGGQVAIIFNNASGQEKCPFQFDCSDNAKPKKERSRSKRPAPEAKVA